MMTKTGLWLTYLSSCRCVFVLQIIGKMIGSYTILNRAQFPQMQDRLFECWKKDSVLYIALLLLIIFSIIWDLYWTRSGHNTRIKYRPEEDSTLEAVLTIVAYLAMAFTINLDAYGIIVSSVILVVLGITIVQTGNLQVCLYFPLHRYHIYTYGKNKIITKKSLEQYRLLLDDEPDGIEARELTPNIYVIFEDK